MSLFKHTLDGQHMSKLQTKSSICIRFSCFSNVPLGDNETMHAGKNDNMNM